MISQFIKTESGKLALESINFPFYTARFRRHYLDPIIDFSQNIDYYADMLKLINKSDITILSYAESIIENQALQESSKNDNFYKKLLNDIGSHLKFQKNNENYGEFNEYIKKEGRIEKKA